MYNCFSVSVIDECKFPCAWFNFKLWELQISVIILWRAYFINIYSNLCTALCSTKISTSAWKPCVKIYCKNWLYKCLLRKMQEQTSVHVIVCNFLWTGDFQVVLYEKSCIFPALCGLTGEKFALGLNFTFTNDCCDTLLCNGVSSSPAVFLFSTLLSLLLTLFYLQ